MELVPSCVLTLRIKGRSSWNTSIPHLITGFYRTSQRVFWFKTNPPILHPPPPSPHPGPQMGDSLVNLTSSFYFTTPPPPPWGGHEYFLQQCSRSNINVTYKVSVNLYLKKRTSSVIITVCLLARAFRLSWIRWVNTYFTTRLVTANPMVLFDGRQTNRGSGTNCSSQHFNRRPWGRIQTWGQWKQCPARLVVSNCSFRHGNRKCSTLSKFLWRHWRNSNCWGLSKTLTFWRFEANVYGRTCPYLFVSVLNFFWLVVVFSHKFFVSSTVADLERRDYKGLKNQCKSMTWISLSIFHCIWPGWQKKLLSLLHLITSPT